MQLFEDKKKLQIYGEYDVAVVGGGVAGISAAIAAARKGAKTILIEKQFTLGGLATLGLITIYLPLCDGCGRQVSFGLAEELLKLSVKHGCEAEGENLKAWSADGSETDRKTHRYRVRFNAQLFAMLAEKQILADGAEILYGTSVCNVICEGKTVKALVTENKSGRQAILAKSIVDCSGDADIFHLAGAKTATFRQGNILAAWYYSIEDGKMNLNEIGAADIPDKDKKGADNEKPLINRRFQGLEGKEISEMVMLSHDQILKRFLAKGDLTDTHAIATIATIPQIRMTRCLAGNYVLDDIDDHKYFDDSIGLIANWKKDGPIYEVPFRCLYSDALANVIASGRCISNTDAMWDIARVIPCCAVTGQAAGTAAAMSSDFSSLDVTALQEQLKSDGVVLHI